MCGPKRLGEMLNAALKPDQLALEASARYAEKRENIRMLQAAASRGGSQVLQLVQRAAMVLFAYINNSVAGLRTPNPSSI